MLSANNTTTILDNIDLYNLDSPVPCYKLRIVGAFCVILFIAGVFFNGALLIAFIKHKKLRTLINYYIIALTVLNFIGCLFTFPFTMISNLNCK